VRYGKDLGLVLAATLVALGICEAGLRWLGRGVRTVSLARAGAEANKPLDPSGARGYIAAMKAAPGTDRTWFLEPPAPLPNRGKPGPDAAARFAEYEKRGAFPPQSEYVWNAWYVESERCNPNGRFAKLPAPVRAFQPQTGTIYPRYRFPANATLVSGLVTNEFGLRGHPLALRKPGRTVRIAFLGASTTIDYHYFAYSYPEYVEHWLNRWAAGNGLNVRFEALNGGREALGSADSAEILREELLPLDPDLAVYYEGANQFFPHEKMIDPAIPPRASLDPKDRIAQPRLPAWLREHFALARLVERALNGFHSAGEPIKPAYRLVWPAGVNERDPDPGNKYLPLRLPHVLRDIDSMRTAIESAGGRLAVCSFEWLAADGMALSPARHEQIYKQLNTTLWPLRYADIRRIADFQNRVFRKFAGEKGIPFIEVAERYPQDPDLFIDAVHMTETGVRVRAWIVFQQLVELLRPRIEAGELPRPPSKNLPAFPNRDLFEMALACTPPSGSFETVANGVMRNEIEAMDGMPKLGPEKRIRTLDKAWAYAASAPLHVPAGERDVLYVVVRAKVLQGKVGAGVLDAETGEFQSEVPLQDGETWVPVLSPGRAGQLIFRNSAEKGGVSEAEVEDVSLRKRKAR
jgi:hypothetical protein